MPPRSVRFHCRGHRNVRALHPKTLELTRAAEISPRATCIVGVAADYDPKAVARLRGPLQVSLAASGHEQRFAARATPFMAAADSLILRRSSQRTGRTFAHDAELSARGLDRGLVAALGDPRTELEVVFEEQAAAAREPGALLVLPQAGGSELTPGLRRFVEAADALAASDPRTLRPWIEGLAPPPQRLALRGRRDVEELRGRLSRGQRLVLAGDCAEMGPGSSSVALVAAAWEDGIPLTCIGPGAAGLRALVLSGFPAWPSVFLGEPRSSAALRQLLAGALTANASAVVASSGRVLRSRLALAAAAGGEAVCAVRDPGGRREALWRDSPEQLAENLDAESDRGRWMLVIAPRESAAEDVEQPPVPNRLLASLLIAGVPVKTLARAAAAEFGGDRRRAYRYLLDLQRARRAEPGGEG